MVCSKTIWPKLRFGPGTCPNTIFKYIFNKNTVKQLIENVLDVHSYSTLLFVELTI